MMRIKEQVYQANHPYKFSERMNVSEASEIFKALSDPNRLTALNLIADSETCACRILEALNITQPTLSHHMRILSDAGLVNIRQEGKWSYYSIAPDVLERTCTYLQTLGADGCTDEEDQDRH